ncbi:MAG: GNAT family N-acetyltransferase [Thermoanaerobaculia bacterium]|nr:GNAT family N-acetyltransferase [Thermoanaerobaculia bacterium]
MSVRDLRADPDELRDLVRLCREHATYERAPFTLDGQEHRLPVVLEDGRLQVWVVELAGRLEGFAAVSREYSAWRAMEYLHLDCLYLRPQIRGRGWGRELLSVAAQHGRDVGCGWMEWQTPPWNERAAGFYEAMGAEAKPKLRYSLGLT